jgi:hypoxanthine phosphoribosyltransferase
MSADKERYWQAMAMLESAEEIHSPADCQKALEEMARAITADLSESHPLVLAVMGGAVVFAGRLLPLLRFPLDFDYIHVSRYGDQLQGSDLHWLYQPENVAGRDILVLDDILDEGHTMHAVREKLLAKGAKSCRSAVFADKAITKSKPIRADYTGLSVPDRYVFGYGMDARGMWRNLDAIYALSEEP